jgi:hypothetical protein
MSIGSSHVLVVGHDICARVVVIMRCWLAGATPATTSGVGYTIVWQPIRGCLAPDPIGLQAPMSIEPHA